MSSRSNSQQLYLAIVCVVVGLLLAPYVGCGASHHNDEHHDEATTSSREAVHEGGAQGSATTEGEPLSQIDQLLSE